MFHSLRRTLPAVLALTVLSAAALPAHAQFYKLKGASVSVGGFGQFTRPLTSSGTPGFFRVPTASGGSTVTFISNKQQYTTNSAGFVTSLQFHPVAWAGVELNYGFTHYSERYAFNYANVIATQRVSVPTDAHEATAAYVFHPKHIKYQPFVNIGGGAIDFSPRGPVQNQWRAAGLLEAGFDIPTMSPNLAFRVEGRSLYYRAPNFFTPAVSTDTWRVTIEPTLAAVYRF